MQPQIALKSHKDTRMRTHDKRRDIHLPTQFGFLFFFFCFLFFLAIETSATSCSSCLPFILSTHTQTHARAECAKKFLSDDYYIVLLRLSRPTVHTVWHTSANWKRCMQRFWSKITAGIDERARANARSTTHTHTRTTYSFDAIVFLVQSSNGSTNSRGSFIVFSMCWSTGILCCE